MRGWLLGSGAFGVVVTAACVLPSKTLDDSPTVFGADVFGRGGTCEACIVSDCADQGSACSADAVCRERATCITRCSQQAYFSPVCYDGCLRDHPGDGALDDALLSCAKSRCRRECNIGSDFRCAGQYSWPTPATTSVKVSMEIVRASLVDGVNGAPAAAGANAIACLSDEVLCEFRSDRTVKVGSDGVVTFSVPTVSSFGTREAWRGYVRLADVPGRAEAIAPTLFFQSRREYRDRERFQAPFATTSEIVEAYRLIDTKLDPTKGTVTGAIYECRSIAGFFADGVTVSVDGLDLRPFYVSGKLPNRELQATDASGAFLIPNVPPATYTFRFERNGLEIARESMVVRADTVTVLGIWPRTK